METITYGNNPAMNVIYDDAGNIEQRMREYPGKANQIVKVLGIPSPYLKRC